MIMNNTLPRLTEQDALEIYQTSSPHDLFQRGREAVETLHPTDVRTFVVERNVNYTNVCETYCTFCAFQRKVKDKDSYTLTHDQIDEKIQALVALGGTQILLQGGLHPELPFSFYEEMLGHIKETFPSIHIHGFSPEEIFYFSQLYDMPLRELIVKMCEAGLDSIPGAGGEILVDRVRDIIAPKKCNTEQWLEVMRQAHAIGMCTTATMMFGHVESEAERIEHLQRVRELQDASLAAKEKDPDHGFFTAFICWPFQPGSTPLSRLPKYNPQSGNAKGGKEILLCGPFEHLRMTALARIYLDNVPNIQASWVTQGPKIGQMSLKVGCNDMGSLMMEENVVSAAGTTFDMKLQQLRDLITTCGYVPVQRNYYYEYLEEPVGQAV